MSSHQRGSGGSGEFVWNCGSWTVAQAHNRRRAALHFASRPSGTVQPNLLSLVVSLPLDRAPGVDLRGVFPDRSHLHFLTQVHRAPHRARAHLGPCFGRRTRLRPNPRRLTSPDPGSRPGSTRLDRRAPLLDPSPPSTDQLLAQFDLPQADSRNLHRAEGPMEPLSRTFPGEVWLVLP